MSSSGKNNELLNIANAKLLRMRQNYQNKLNKIEEKYSLKTRHEKGIGKSAQIESLFKSINKELKKSRRQNNNKYSDVWEKVAGKEIALAARPGNIKNGYLSIKVNNPVLKSELENFCSESLLELLKQETGDKKLRGLKFTLVKDFNS